MNTTPDTDTANGLPGKNWLKDYPFLSTPLPASDRLSVILIVFLSLLAISPFVFNLTTLDYDSHGVIASLSALNTSADGYHVFRAPGSPSFELPLAFLYRWIKKIGLNDDNIWLSLQWGSWIIGVCFLLTFYSQLRKNLSARSSFFATLAIGFHPLFLWHNWALVEDISALTLSFFGWILSQREDKTAEGAFLLAWGTSMKAFGMSWFLAAVVFSVMMRRWRKSVTFIIWFCIFYFFLIAPALADFNMDFFKMFITPDY
ncbi:MAG TPA: hypothetical protein PK876_10275, partial [Elusimicrobiota bacterium]|nr:hypothetical protein [Elusimicrobiota bacterium]